ncbi:hypothetical protein AGMMS49983_03470 [Clostridia bacterium]|nr:hypothetical protein AGMMS49983_03470 [Clostridia bacterium]
MFPLTKKVRDHSGENAFSFSFFCDRCGKEWGSPRFRCECGGVTAFDSEEAKKRIWADEHRAARERANLEAILHFNYCARNEEWICDECFVGCESGGSDVCAACFAGTDAAEPL